MAYSLCIKRAGESIELEDWIAAVEAMEGIRISESNVHTAVNPLNGSTLSMPVSPGDAEIFDAETGEWRFAVRLIAGEATFNARILSGAADPDSSESLWIMFVEIAAKLDAIIAGEEGEIYDSDTKW